MTTDERLARLAVEVAAELERLEGVVREIEAARVALTDDSGQLVRMGFAGYLHSFYTGCEAILARIARVVGDLPAGADWHRALLFQATAPVPGGRAPVLRPSTAAALDGLLRFRHFFRVAYGVELEAEKLRRLGASVRDLFDAFRGDVEGLWSARGPASEEGAEPPA